VIWILQQPPVLVASLTVLLTIGLALAGLVLFRRVVPQSRLTKSASVTGQTFTLVGVLYPLVAAFALSTVWEQHQTVQAATDNEAAAIADLLNESEALPMASRSEIQRKVLAYARDVIDDEFPRMRSGQPIERRSTQLREIRLSLYASEPVSRTEIAAYEDCVASLRELTRSRLVRTAGGDVGSSTQLAPELWVLLIGGGIISLVFTYTFATNDFVLHAVCVALTAALLAFVLYLILTLDRPFVGSLSVSPDSYQRVVSGWQLHSGPP
jgi:hypothetical protein